MFRFSIKARYTSQEESGFAWPECSPETGQRPPPPPSAAELALQEELVQAFLRTGPTLSFTDRWRGPLSFTVKGVEFTTACGVTRPGEVRQLSSWVIIEAPCFTVETNQGLGGVLGEWLGTQTIRDGTLAVTTRWLELGPWGPLQEGEGEGSSCSITQSVLYDAW